MDEGLISHKNVEQVLLLQKRESHFFGNICCSLNMITPLDNYHVLHKYDRLINMQTYLRNTGVLKTDSITRCNTKAMEKRIPFLSVLMQENLLSRQQLAQILFDLYHVPLRSVHEFVFQPRERSRFAGLVPEKSSRKNGVIPLSINNRTVICGTTSPEGLLYIHSLNERFPLYRFESCFIPLSGFNWFYKPVYDASPGNLVPSIVPGAGTELKHKYSVLITDPISERETVRSLYEKYELFLALSGCEPNEDRHLAFLFFIKEQYARIREEFQCPQVEFSIETRHGQPIITALPYM